MGNVLRTTEAHRHGGGEVRKEISGAQEHGSSLVEPRHRHRGLLRQRVGDEVKNRRTVAAVVLSESGKGMVPDEGPVPRL